MLRRGPHQIRSLLVAGRWWRAGSLSCSGTVGVARYGGACAVLLDP